MAEATPICGPGEEDRYERLVQYEFQDNPKFMDGWKKIVNIIDESQMNDSLIKAQVFFYSREVEPVDLAGFKQWLSANNKSLVPPDIEQLEQDNTLDKEPSDTCDTQTLSSSEVGNQSKNFEVGNQPKNFAELVAMVQSGLPLPGTDGVNIEPTNDEPSSPVMQRPKKPWEVQVEN